MKKLSHIQQHDEKDCGAACLSMICEYFGAKFTLARLRELIKVDSQGANIYGLVQGASQLGLDALPLQGSAEEFVEGIENKEIGFPFIARIVNEDMFEHFIVVYGIKKGKFIVGDPGKNRIIKMSAQTFFEQWQGQLVTFSKRDDFQEVNERKGTLRKYFKFILAQKKMLVFVFIMSIIITGINMFGSLIFQYVLNDSVQMVSDAGIDIEDDCDDENCTDDEHNHEASEEDTLDENDEHNDHDHADVDEHSDEGSSFDKFLFKLESKLEVIFKNINTVCITIILMYIFKMLLSVLRGYILAITAKKVDIPLTFSYYDHLIDLPADFHQNRNTGELMSRFYDTSKIRDAISATTLTIMLDTIMAIGCGVILFRMSSTLFLITLGIVLVYGTIMVLFRKPIRNVNHRIMEDEARVTSYLKETVDGISTIKAYNSETVAKNKSKKLYTKFIDSNVKGSLVFNYQESIVGAIASIGIVVLLWVGTHLVLHEVISLMDLFMFYYLIEYFLNPISNLINLQPELQTAFVAAERLDDVVEAKLEDRDGETLQQVNGDIAINNVDFRYGNRELVLNNVNMTFKKGTKTAIVGESGCGKTTIAKLLLAFFKPEQGEISIDNNSLYKYSVDSIRDRIAYVPQDIFFFADTVYNNLTCGDESITREEVERVCKLCSADEFIHSLPMEYDTMLEENASNLSGGQKQRLAIARALLRKPSVLIMDEATSNLDSVTELGIRNTIDELSKDITCIIIAHRINTIKNCDYIYVMDKGCVMEEGKHDELMELNGLYSEYVNSNI